MKNLIKGVVVACVLAGVLGSVSLEAGPKWVKKTKPGEKLVCVVAVCNWSPCGAWCTISMVPCGSEPGEEPGDPGVGAPVGDPGEGAATNSPTPARR